MICLFRVSDVILISQCFRGSAWWHHCRTCWLTELSMFLQSCTSKVRILLTLLIPNLNFIYINNKKMCTSYNSNVSFTLIKYLTGKLILLYPLLGSCQQDNLFQPDFIGHFLYTHWLLMSSLKQQSTSVLLKHFKFNVSLTKFLLFKSLLLILASNPKKVFQVKTIKYTVNSGNNTLT